MSNVVLFTLFCLESGSHRSRPELEPNSRTPHDLYTHTTLSLCVPPSFPNSGHNRPLPYVTTLHQCECYHSRSCLRTRSHDHRTWLTDPSSPLPYLSVTVRELGLELPTCLLVSPIPPKVLNLYRRCFRIFTFHKGALPLTDPTDHRPYYLYSGVSTSPQSTSSRTLGGITHSRNRVPVLLGVS